MQDYRRFITSNPNILFGKPAIKDTRIAVEHILDELAGGTTIEQLLEEYPRLSREAMRESRPARPCGSRERPGCRGPTSACTR